MNAGRSRATSSRSTTRSSAHPAKFVATSWTAVLAAGQPQAPHAREALSKLCETYWAPLHDYVRRLGHPEADAKDLTQEFFWRLLSKNVLAAADPHRGRFRTFLLSSLNHFLHNEWRRGRAAKRGAGQSPLSLDADGEEDQPACEPATELSPAAIYDQRWAATVFEQARARLAEEYAAAGKSTLFEQFLPFLETRPGARGYHTVAGRLRMTPNAVGVAVHRMRQRLGELIRAEIANTQIR